jgi:two-component system nitrate/nitrite response regulator NarL
MTVETAKKSSSVVIVNPSRLFREGLKQLLRKSRIGIDRDGCSVAEILGANQTHPADLVICSMNLDERADTELQALPELRGAFPKAKVIVLTDVMSASGVRAAVRAGIDGILSAEVSHDVLQRSLELVLLGQTLFPARFLHPQDDAKTASADGTAQAQSGEGATVLPREMNRRIGDRINAERLAAERATGPQLSEREGQILQCLVLGSSNKAIARKFNISEATVKVHIRALLRKIRVSNRTQAAIWALNNRPQSAAQSGVATERLTERLNERSAERLNGRAAATILEPSHA